MSFDRHPHAVKITLPTLKIFSLSIQCFYYLDVFQGNVPFLYPINTPENQRFSDVFRGYRNETLARDWVKETKKCETKMVRNADI